MIDARAAASSTPHTSRPMPSCLGQRARRGTPHRVPRGEHRRARRPRPVNSMSPPSRRLARAVPERERGFSPGGPWGARLALASPSANRPQKSCASARPLTVQCSHVASTTIFFLPLSCFLFPSPTSGGLRSFARSACSLPPEIFRGHHHHRRKATRIYCPAPHPTHTNVAVSRLPKASKPWLLCSPVILKH